MMISKKTRKRVSTLSALFAAPVAMTAVGAGAVSADTAPIQATQDDVLTNSAASSADSSAKSSAASATVSAVDTATTNYRTVVVQPDSAMTNYLNQAAANGMKGEMVATITNGIHNKGNDTSDSTVTVNKGGSVTVTLADANTLAGVVTTTFSNGMVLTSTITNGKMSTHVTTEPTSGASYASSAASSATSSAAIDNFSDAVSIHSSAASSAAGSAVGSYIDDDLSYDDDVHHETTPSTTSTTSHSSNNSGALTAGTEVTAFTLNNNDPKYVENHDGNEYAKFSTDQSIDLFEYYWAKLRAAAIGANLSDSQYFKLLDAASQPGGTVYNKLVYDEDLTADQKAALVTDAYQLARQIAAADSNYTLSDVDTTNSPDDSGKWSVGDPNGDDGDNDVDPDTDDLGDDGSDSSAKTLPQAGEEDTSAMSVAGMAIAGVIALAEMLGLKHKRQEVPNKTTNQLK